MTTVERARRAYALNNIPFTDDVARLPEAVLLEAAIAWEKRASEGVEDLSILELKRTEDIVARLRKLSGYVCQGKTAATVIGRQEAAYHGHRFLAGRT